MMHKKSVFSGMYWITVVTFISKFIGFIAQVVLGWLLSQEEFGLFAIILSLSASVSFLRNGGSQDVLVQRGKRFDKFAPAVLMFSLVFNAAASVILLAIAFVASHYYSEPLIIYGLVLISLSIILTTPAPVLVAKLSIESYFDKLAIVTLISNISRHGLAILLALLGFGVYSFIFPIVIEPIIMFILLLIFVRYIPKISNSNFVLFKEVFSASKWVMASNLALALIMNGQYFFVSLFQERGQLGVYFFAMQLIFSICLIISQPINQVFYPKLCNISDDNLDHGSTSLRTLYGTMSVSVIAGLILYLIAGYLITFLWSGKWDDAIACVRWLAFSIPASLMMTLCFSICASKGIWRARFYMLTMCAVVDVIFVSISAYLGDPETIAIYITIGRIMSSLVIVSIALKIIDLENFFCYKIKSKLMVPLLLVFIVTYIFESSVLDLDIYVLLTILVTITYYIYLIRFELEKLIFVGKSK